MSEPLAALIVEDDPDMRLLIGMVLRRDARLRIVGEAVNSEDAIALARELLPRLVILDHSIEGAMTGLETAPSLREASPDAKIVLFTAYDMAAEARDEPAVDAFLRKDDVSRLLPTAQQLLGLDAA